MGWKRRVTREASAQRKKSNSQQNNGCGDTYVCVCVGSHPLQTHRQAQAQVQAPIYIRNPAKLHTSVLLLLPVLTRQRHRHKFAVNATPRMGAPTSALTLVVLRSCSAASACQVIACALPYFLLLDHAEIKWCNVRLRDAAVLHAAWQADLHVALGVSSASGRLQLRR